MKNSTIYLFFSALTGFLMISCGFAEEMTDRAADSPEGREMSYVISLDNTNDNVARDTWKNYMSKHKSKVVRIKGSKVNMSKNVAIDGLGGDIDVKSLFEKRGDDTEMRLWFVKDKKYITQQSDPTAYNNIDRFIDQFFTELDAAHVKLEVKNEETIKEIRIKIEENLREQDQIADKIQGQRNVIQQTQKKLSDVQSN